MLTETSDLGKRKALYHGGYKFIFDLAGGSVEVFDYRRDVLDQVDLFNDPDASVIEDACGVLDKKLRRNAAFAAGISVPERPLQEFELEKLRSLGYVDATLRN